MAEPTMCEAVGCRSVATVQTHNAITHDDQDWCARHAAMFEPVVTAPAAPRQDDPTLAASAPEGAEATGWGTVVATVDGLTIYGKEGRENIHVRHARDGFCVTPAAWKAMGAALATQEEEPAWSHNAYWTARQMLDGPVDGFSRSAWYCALASLVKEFRAASPLAPPPRPASPASEPRTAESERFRHGQKVRVTYGGEDRGTGTYLFYDAQCAWPHRVLMDEDGQENVWTAAEVMPVPPAAPEPTTCEHHVGSPMAADLCGKVRPCPKHDPAPPATPEPERGAGETLAADDLLRQYTAGVAREAAHACDASVARRTNALRDELLRRLTASAAPEPTTDKEETARASAEARAAGFCGNPIPGYVGVVCTRPPRHEWNLTPCHALGPWKDRHHAQGTAASPSGEGEPETTDELCEVRTMFEGGMEDCGEPMPCARHAAASPSGAEATEGLASALSPDECQGCIIGALEGGDLCPVHQHIAALTARLRQSEQEREALSLREMQAINAARSARWMAGSPGWTTLEIAGELAGEVGELANVCKKLRRSEMGVPGNKLSDDELRQQARSEMADVFIVLMLTASKLGVDLYCAVCDTFNAKSEQMGFPEKFQGRTRPRGDCWVCGSTSCDCYKRATLPSLQPEVTDG